MFFIVLGLIKLVKSYSTQQLSIKTQSLYNNIDPKDGLAFISITATVSNGIKIYLGTSKNDLNEISNNFMTNVNIPCTYHIYYTTQYCTEYQELIEKKVIFDSDEYVTKSITVTNNDIPKSCLYPQKTFYVNLKNDLSGLFDSQLFVQTRTGEKKEISKNEVYSDSVEGYEAFSIYVFIKTSSCEMQRIGSLEATEKSIIVPVNDSYIPNICLQYLICIDFDIPNLYKIGYSDTIDSNSNIKPIINHLTLTSENPFEVNLYLMENANCDQNEILKSYSADKSVSCLSFTINDIPSKCQIPFKVCFDISKISNDFSFGYTINDLPESTMKELSNTPIESTNKFNVTLYLIKSPLCKNNIKMDTYIATQDFQCIELTEKNIDDECKQNHYIKILNKLSDNNYLKLNTSKYYDTVGKSYEISKKEPFKLHLFVETPICQTNYIYMKTIFSSSDSEHFEIITDNDIPSECTMYYFCGDFSDLSNKYEISYTVSFEKGNPVHILDHAADVSISHNHPFSISYNLTKSPNCAKDEISGTIESSLLTSVSPVCKNYDNDIIPIKCRENNKITPYPTDVLSFEKIESIEEYLDPSKYDDFNVALKKKFSDMDKNINNQGKIKIVHVMSDEIIFNAQLEEDQVIHVNSNSKIIYKGGDLRLDSNEDYNIILNDENQLNIGLAKTNQNSEYSTLNLQLNQRNSEKSDETMYINFISPIKYKTDITVPDNVTTINFNTLNFSNNIHFGITKQNGEPVKINVKTIELKDRSSISLSNLKIEESITIQQNSLLYFEDAEINENATINFIIHYFANFIWYPSLMGTFNKAVKIKFSNIHDHEKPLSYIDYEVLKGKFIGSTCQEWGEKIDFSNSVFDEFLCKKSSTYRSDESILYVKIKQNDKKFPLAIVIGVVVAVVVVIIVVIVIVIIIIRRKRNNNNNSESQANENNNFDPDSI